ncbi:MAG: TolC family protein [Bacteroidales bacterium]|nr:TolC family protein [Bacteroidales bacterium]
MKKQILLFGLLIWMLPLGAQNLRPVSLNECLQKAVENYPDRKQLANNQKEFELNTQNLDANYLPSLNLNGQASYQSEVTHISLSLPGVSIPSVSKDQYKINLNLEQLIWDGGATKAQKQLAQSNYKIADQQVQVSLYQLKNSVSVSYFQVLFLKENLKALYVMRDDLKARIKDARTAVDNGALLLSDLQTLQVSEKQAEQLITEKEADINATLAALSELTGIKLASAKQITAPDLSLNSNFPFDNQRPEYKLLEARQNKIEAMTKLTSVQRRPILKLFGQAGYGRPGYNMLNDKFSDYYIGGVQLYWKIWDWSKTKHEKQILTLQNNNLEASKETFTRNLQAEYRQQLIQIEKFKELIQSDKEIVTLQNQVMKTAENKFKNGTLTTTDYLIELNKKVKAVLNLEAHKTQLLFSQYQYLMAMGSI